MFVTELLEPAQRSSRGCSAWAPTRVCSGPPELVGEFAAAPGAAVGAPRRGALRTRSGAGADARANGSGTGGKAGARGAALTGAARARRRAGAMAAARVRARTAREPAPRRRSARALRAAGDAREHPDRRRPRGERVAIAEVCERLQISEEELREDVNVLNVVNFGGGSYVLYAEIKTEEERRDRGRSRALQRQLRPPRAAAAGRGARRWSRRST